MEIEKTIFQCDQKSYLDFIPIIDGISYNSFFQNYLIKNQACIIKNVADNWSSSKCWVENGSPNLTYLNLKYGKCDVVVYNCHEKYYNSQKTKECTFEDYLKYWREFEEKSYVNKKELLYLKDWHLRNKFASDLFYQVPEYFQSDWLNEYLCDISEDDYRFVYMGPKGTWTPFHADVFNSYSWSTNICGQKRWILFPPGEETYLRDKHGNLPYDILTVKHNLKCFEVLQNAGDAVFVPSGWYHQVFNLKDTISINHNWINACNLCTVYKALIANLNNVKNEIKDCQEMDNFVEHCQIMLNCNFGMNFQKFYDFIEYIAVKRLKEVDIDQIVSKHHAVFDLMSIKHTLEPFLNHEDFSKVVQGKSQITPRSLLKQIQAVYV